MSGKLSPESFTFRYAKWKVPDIFKLQSNIGFFLQSQEFCFADDRYCLRLYPNGREEYASGVYVDISLLRLATSAPERGVRYKLWFKSITGGELQCETGESSVRDIKFYVLRTALREKKDAFVSGGEFTMVCKMLLRESSSVRRSPYNKAETFSVDPVLAAHELEQKKLSGLDKLLSDYKQLLLKESESDALLLVSGKEFRAHRNILRARSPVFDAMFDHETVEKESGRVIIEDLDPDSFRDFLEYVYTGRLEAMSEVNAFGLYAAADKYDVPTLKSECVQCIRKTLSVESFSDVITLALRHTEEELKELAIKFFKKNLAQIIVTTKWQLFMSENSTTANELLIKAIVPTKH